MLKCLAVMVSLILVDLKVGTAATTLSGQAKDFGFELELVASELTSPHFLVNPPNDSRRFVVDLIGKIYILDESGKVLSKPFLDLTSKMVSLQEGYDERGLLGLAFSPQFLQDGIFFVYYSAPLQKSAPRGWNHTSHVSKFKVSAKDPNLASLDSEKVILKIDQPQFNHNSGRLMFGSDGYLYISVGDGGSGADQGTGHPQLGNGQDVSTLLGSVLRLDVSVDPYQVPKDNPLVDKKLDRKKGFAGDTARPEIWAWGLRNVWGMTLDADTGKIFAADVGQGRFEEVNILQPGNFGWHIKEGGEWFDPQNLNAAAPLGSERGLMGETLMDPILSYKNLSAHKDGEGISVVGGYVYRGTEIPELIGHYIFGDFSQSRANPSGSLFVASPPKDTKEGKWTMLKLQELNQFILGFGQDHLGEVYVMTSQKLGPSGQTGRIWKLRAQAKPSKQK